MMVLFQRMRLPFTEAAAEPETPTSPPGRSVREALRQQRCALGLDLQEVAAVLRIKPEYLAAIEEGQFDKLPGAPYALGFLRSYSDHLGLDSAEMLRRFKVEAAGLAAKPDLAFPMPLGEHSLPGRGVLVAAMVLAISGYGLWYYVVGQNQSSPAIIAEVPPTLHASRLAPSNRHPPLASAASDPSDPQQRAGSTAAAPDNGQTDSSPTAVNHPADASGEASFASGPVDRRPSALDSQASSSSLAAAARAATAPAPTAPPGSTAAASSTPVPEAPATIAADKPSSSAEQAPQSAPPLSPIAASAAVASSPPEVETSMSPAKKATDAPGPSVSQTSRITVKANGVSWIRVRAADRSVLFTGVLRPGEAYQVPDRPGLSMRAGNAGGIEILVDGKQAPTLGPNGAVRNVVLDPQSLMGHGPGQN